MAVDPNYMLPRPPGVDNLLIKKGARVYYWRRRIPKDILGLFEVHPEFRHGNSQGQIVESLETGDYRKVGDAAVAAEARWLAKWERMRATAKAASRPLVIESITDPQAQAILWVTAQAWTHLGFNDRPADEMLPWAMQHMSRLPTQADAATWTPARWKEWWRTIDGQPIRRVMGNGVDKPKSGRIAVKVINHLGDEVMKVFGV